jgi:hypothetical protein
VPSTIAEVDKLFAAGAESVLLTRAEWGAIQEVAKGYFANRVEVSQAKREVCKAVAAQMRQEMSYAYRSGQVPAGRIFDWEMRLRHPMDVSWSDRPANHSEEAGGSAALKKLGRFWRRCFDPLEFRSEKDFGVHRLAICKTDLIDLAAHRRTGCTARDEIAGGLDTVADIATLLSQMLGRCLAVVCGPVADELGARQHLNAVDQCIDFLFLRQRHGECERGGH